jgi:hypothetical protein
MVVQIGKTDRSQVRKVLEELKNFWSFRLGNRC